MRHNTRFQLENACMQIGNSKVRLRKNACGNHPGDDQHDEVEGGLQTRLSGLDSLAFVRVAGVFEWLHTHHLPDLRRPEILMGHFSIE